MAWGYREGENNRTRSVPADQLVPTQVAADAERAEFHSMRFPDHVCMPLETASAHAANVTGKRSYSSHHEMLDAAAVMGAVAATTSTLKLGTSVLVAPYRGPLNDARQFATINFLSGRRLILGVGPGWMAEEFAGTHYQFHDISMDPEPIQKPRPPIIYGSVTELGAKRSARHCDGFYPLFLDPFAEPHRYTAHQDIIRGILDETGRAEDTFTMMGAVTVHVTSEANATGPDGQRMICSGSVEQVLDDLQAFAAAGYSMMVMKLVCPTGEVTELSKTIEQVGRDIIPTATSFEPGGDWQAAL